MRLRAKSNLSIKTDHPPLVAGMDYTRYAVSNHSRESSGASDSYSPLTPTFSLREHSRMASTNSSLASTPPTTFDMVDSPMAPSKTVLHDLVEEPSEREEGSENIDVPEDMRKLSACSSCEYCILFITSLTSLLIIR